MKAISYVFFFLMLIASTTSYAQIKFEAKVSKKKLGINERLRIDFEMNKDGDNFNPPSFSNFTVVGGPNTSVSNSWLNGKRSFKKTYTYFLAPKKRGTFTIKQATIEIEGNVYKTIPVTVTVTKAVDKPKDGNNAEYIASETVHLVAEVSNSKPYLNEPVTVVYKLYVSPTTGVSNWREVDNPRYNDFWSQDIEIKSYKEQNATYKGEDYRYVVLKRTVLYPQKTGKLEIEPLSLDITVEVPTNRRDLFGTRIMSQVHKIVSAGSRTLNVKPLPEQGKPDNFTGAVGDFKFNVSTSKKELEASESFQLKVEVSGKGNLKLFELPTPVLPSSLEVYEPEKNDRVRTLLSGMSGSKSESYTVVPQYKGKYPLPKMTFSYFDLNTKNYKTLSSDEIIIDVLGGPVNTENQTVVENTKKQSVPTISNQFAFIKTKTKFTPVKPSYFFKSNLFWALLLVPFLIIPIAIFVRKKKAERDADVKGNRIRKADRLAKKYLSKAKSELGKKESFYVALEKALHNYLKAKLHIETSEFSKDKIKVLLNEKGVDETTISNFIAILENCELARYTPITQVTMNHDYEKSASTISSIDKQMR
ncbi:BatD family protein [Ichthyenterobacterium sp. W332]|uniref:BatD family protein n=1 Tax=Microcosmobacter mediterraneus TaxID=3075607 RepID=A0ABU2YLQ6_9FLAO|nr:BatD family protein [Ichthyenterobacterium sp. W332]MDT0558205.1 BatD family protein [Ichthyenterobacterium sp. W332]